MASRKKDTTDKKPAKSFKKSPIKDTKKYDCDEVEKYLDKAIARIKNELVPKVNAIDRRDRDQFRRGMTLIELIDKRDKDQYDFAKKIIVDANEAAAARQTAIEEKVDAVKEEVEEIYETRKEMIDNLMNSMNLLHEAFTKLNGKLDEHITVGTVEFAGIQQKLEKTGTHVEAIQKTLDDVSANGNKGLSASFTDMYTKLQEMQTVTQGARARAKFWTDLNSVVSTTPLLKPLKHKWGAIVYIGIFLLILNTVLHGFNLQFDLFSIVKWLLLIAKGG